MAVTYTPATNFGAKDSLPVNDPAKVIKGSEFTTEFTAIQTAFSNAAPSASPTFTGTVTIASVDINGGTIDGVTIGGSSAGAASFTTLTASGDVNFDSGTFFVDASADAVGIGTTSFNAANKLEVTGDINTTWASGASRFIGMRFADGSLYEMGLIVKESPELQVYAKHAAGAPITFLTGTTPSERMRITSGGDISFYEDTGTTPKFFWDASAEALGIGTTSPIGNFTVADSGTPIANPASLATVHSSTTDKYFLKLTSADFNADGNWIGLGLGYSSGYMKSAIISEAKDAFGRANLHFALNSSTGSSNASLSDSRVVINYSGNVGLGVTPGAYDSGYRALQIGTTANFMGTASGDGNWISNNAIFSDGAWKYIQTAAASSLDMQSSTAPFRFRYAASGTAGNAISWSEAMRIDSSGSLLVGTSTPVGTEQVLIASSSAGSQPQQLNLKDTNASANGNYFLVARKSDDTYVGGLRRSGTDTAMAVDGTAHLAFQISGTEVGRFDGSGNLLVGTTSASAKLVAEGSGSAAQMIRGFATNASYTGQVIQSLASRNTTNESYEFLRCSVNGVADRLKIYDNGNVENTNNSYGSLSDIKLKENIVDASPQWDDIKGLQFRKYNFKEETGQSTHTQMGLIAQEVELVCPGIVKETTDRDQEGNDLGTTTKSIQYSLVYVKAVKALQEAMARIETLEAEVAALKGA